MSTFQIRLSAIESNYRADNDTLRYRRELSRLLIDINRQINLGNNSDELINLKNNLEGIIHGNKRSK